MQSCQSVTLPTTSLRVRNDEDTVTGTLHVRVMMEPSRFRPCPCDCFVGVYCCTFRGAGCPTPSDWRKIHSNGDLVSVLTQHDRLASFHLLLPCSFLPILPSISFPPPPTPIQLSRIWHSASRSDLPALPLLTPSASMRSALVLVATCPTCCSSGIVNLSAHAAFVLSAVRL